MFTKKQKYYKVLTRDLKAPVNRKFSYEGWETRTFKVEEPLIMCRQGLHLYKSLNNISIGNFGERVFEAIPIGRFISDKNKICCQKVRLIRELKPGDVKDSEWAYDYCCRVEDKSEVYKNITDSKWAYKYCRNIKDRPEVYKNVTDFMWAYWYCYNIKNRKEIFRNITSFRTICRYCSNIKKYKFCKSIIYTVLNWPINVIVKNISKLRKYITNKKDKK